MSSKKGSKAQASEATYQVKDVVLAKVKGYPPWPAMIVDPDNVAKHVRKERPVSKKTTFYCVKFFPAGDYSWAVAKDLSRLLPHEIEAYISEPSKKNPELKKGYEIALNPTAWEEENKRKEEAYEAALAEQEETVDQLDEDEDGGEEEVESEPNSTTGKKNKKSQGSKKRKRENSNAEDQKKKRKSAQEALSATRRPVAGSKRANKSKGSSAEHVESEDGEDATGDADGSVEPTEKKPSKGRSKGGEERSTKRGKKDKEDEEAELDEVLAKDPEAQRVKEWRHKLQRAFLTGKSPTPEDMPGLDQIFQTVETYPNLTIDYLQFSKIGKVMRRIATLDEIPRDAEFHFKDRAQQLVLRWQQIIQQAEEEGKVSKAKANGAAGTDASEAASREKEESKPEINGTSHDAKDASMANGDSKEAAQANGDDTEGQDEQPMDTSDS